MAANIMHLPLEDMLQMWVVCRSPADYPGMFTARRHFIGEGITVVEQNVIVEQRLITIRRKMIRAGLTRLPRQEQDEPQILEVWL